MDSRLHTFIYNETMFSNEKHGKIVQGTPTPELLSSII